jgi:phosphopantetheine adenylyltransferase
MLDFFGSSQAFSLAQHFERKEQIHALTRGNNGISIVLHNSLHLYELHWHSHAMCLISSLRNGKDLSYSYVYEGILRRPIRVRTSFSYRRICPKTTI